MKKILILGAHGYIGRNLLQYMSVQQFNTSYSIKAVDLTQCEINNIPIHALDVSIRENLFFLLENEKPDFIINLIGYYKSNDYNTAYALNAKLSKDICDAIILYNLKPEKILLIGSAAEYGSNPHIPYSEDSELMPVNIYGLTKAFQTQIAKYYFQNHYIPVNIARIFNLISHDVPQELSIGAFIHKIRSAEQNSTIEVGNISSKRDFIHINDAVDALWKILLKGNKGEVYNVCNNALFSIREILQLLVEQSGKKIDIKENSYQVKNRDIFESFGRNSLLTETTFWKPNFSVLKQRYI